MSRPVPLLKSPLPTIAPLKMKAFLKRQFLKRDVWFQHKSGILIENWRSELTFDVTFVIAHLLQRRDPLTFVQIGAYDGAANDALSDFIRRGRLHGVLVEPQPEAFARLRENYRGLTGLAFENSAIGVQSGTLPFYRVKAEYESQVERSRQMSGFSPDVILKHYAPLMADPRVVLETINVPVVTLPELLNRHGMTTPDVVQIDTEGYDYIILQALNLQQQKPAIIGFETVHLSRPDRTRAYELLLRHDYLIYEAGPDCVAYQRAVRTSAPGFWS